METFNEFDQTGSSPQKNFSDIIGFSFNHYFKIIGWCILLFILYLILSSAIGAVMNSVLGLNSLQTQAEMQSIFRDKDSDNMLGKILAIPGYKESMGVSFILGILLYPFYVGFAYMMHKANTNQQIMVSDAFVGFRKNFLQLLIFGLISSIIVSIGLMLCGFGVLFLAPFVFIGAPIILFENKSAIEATTQSFQIASKNYGTFWGVVAVTILISLAGILLRDIGLLATIPFYYAAMYGAYVAYCGVPRETV